MLPRIGSLEPGIEHAVRKNKIRRGGSAQGAPDTEAVVAPESVNNYRVVFRVPSLDPVRKTRGVGIAAPAGTKRMHWHGEIPDPGIRRRVQGNDIDRVPALGENHR